MTDEELVDALVEAAYARSIGGVVGTGEYDVARAALLDRLRMGREAVGLLREWGEGNGDQMWSVSAGDFLATIDDD